MHFERNNISGRLVIKHGIDAQIITTLSRVLNFTYTLVDCHQQWGALTGNNTWTGIMGALTTNVRHTSPFKIKCS